MEKSQLLNPGDEFFDQLGMQYEEAFGHDTGLHRIIQTFLGLLPLNVRVLDCGCGTGKPVGYAIANSGRQIHGIDLSQTMVELSQKQVPSGSFQKANMLHYTPADQFDGVVAMFSLFVLNREELTSMASKWFQWLRPNGLLLIGVIGADDCETTPEMYDADGKCASGIGYTFMNHRVSITVFTKAGWIGLLEGVGFEIVHTESDFFSPPPTAVSDDEMHFFIIARKRSST